MAFLVVATHVVVQQRVDVGVGFKDDRLQPHRLADEVDELLRGDFTQTFESGDFRLRADLLDGILLLLVGIAVEGLGFVAHAEQRGLQDIDVPVAHHIGDVIKKVGEQQQTNVHAIDIGIGGDDDIVVTESLQTVLDVEGRVEEAQLLVFVHLEHH